MEKISFKDLSAEISRHWIAVIVCIFLSVLFGIFSYKLKPKEYTSRVQFLLTPTQGESQQSRLGSLASIAGINLTAEAVGIPSSAYEFILSSSNFLLDVVDEEIVFEGDTILIANYLNQRMVMGMKNKMAAISQSAKQPVKYEALEMIDTSRVRSNSMENLLILELPPKVGSSINILRNHIEFSKEERKPISINVTLQDPEASARIVKVLIEKLEEHINRYSQNNKEDNTSFLRSEVEKAQNRLYSSQVALARAKDRNINANRAIVNVEIERRMLDLSQAQKTYSDLSAQLENAKIQVEKTAPLFIILEPPSILNVNSPTAPRLVIYIVLSLFAGAFVSLFFIFFKAFYRRNY